MELENIVINDIKSFLAEQPSVFLNEKDMQIKLSVFLTLSRNEDGVRNYDEVDVEYYIPYDILDGYLWKNELYLDIVVRSGDEYVAIELKYPTKVIDEQIVRFGKTLPHTLLLKKHSAYNIRQYSFWKDVRRLELVKKRFPAVKKGLAVLLTNDMKYLKPHKKGTKCEQFSTNEGLHSPVKHWGGDAGEKMSDEGYPDFTLDKQYFIDWHHANLGAHEFIYCIVEV